MNKTKIYYLEPLSSYRTPLRSDTLWGILCWGIYHVHGKSRLDNFIASYGNGAINNNFIITSAYPYVKNNDGYTPFFPVPKKTVEPYKELSSQTFEELKVEMRCNKKKRKVSLISKFNFQQLINGNQDLTKEDVPTQNITAVTHNSIDRRNGGTLKLNGQGQLFHVEERFWVTKENETAGIYFLAKGNFDLLESVLRFLSHYGFGGDRGTGKGHFNITWEDFELEEPKDANAMMNMSLYYPTKEEAVNLSANNNHFYYDIEDRQGKLGGRMYFGKQIWKDVIPMFKEGSVFPIELYQDNTIYGNNPIVKPKEDGVTDYDVYQYGKAFMIKVKI